MPTKSNKPSKKDDYQKWSIDRLSRHLDKIRERLQRPRTDKIKLRAEEKAILAVLGVKENEFALRRNNRTQIDRLVRGRKGGIHRLCSEVEISRQYYYACLQRGDGALPVHLEERFASMLGVAVEELRKQPEMFGEEGLFVQLPPLRIVEATALNFQNLQNTTIAKDGRPSVASEDGISALRALEYMFRSAGYSPRRPIRLGASEVRVEVKLESVEKSAALKKQLIIIKNQRDGQPPTYTVSGNGMQNLSEAERLTESLVSRMGISPERFLAKLPAEQTRIVAEIFGADFREVDERYHALLSQREHVAGELARFELLLKSEPEKKNEGAEKFATLEDSPDLVLLAAMLTRFEPRNDEDRNLRSRAIEVAEEVAKLREESKQLAQRVNAAEAEFTSLVRKIEYTMNSRQATRDISVARTELEMLDKELERLDIERHDILQKIRVPMDDLTIELEGMAIEGVPYEDCSDEKRLEVVLELLNVENPKLKMLYLSDNRLFSEKLNTLAQNLGIQIWKAPGRNAK